MKKKTDEYTHIHWHVFMCSVSMVSDMPWCLCQLQQSMFLPIHVGWNDMWPVERLTSFLLCLFPNITITLLLLLIAFIEKFTLKCFTCCSRQRLNIHFTLYRMVYKVISHELSFLIEPFHIGFHALMFSSFIFPIELLNDLSRIPFFCLLR